MTMWIKSLLAIRYRLFRISEKRLRTSDNEFKIWHIRHDRCFTPFVVVVGSKYFLPVPDCLLFDLECLRA